MRNLLLMIFAALTLSACVGVKVWAPDEAVAKAAYSFDGPTRLTLYTMINNKTGWGAHSSLMINGTQRVIFDPAGSFKHKSLVERNDVIFGITPEAEDVYTRYHARKTFRVQVQQIDVSPEVAELALREVLAYGPVGSAKCARSTSAILSRLPGFEFVNQTWFPRNLAAQLSKMPGVTSRELYEYDSDDNSKVLLDWNPA